jgi:hypothetical protein
VTQDGVGRKSVWDRSEDISGGQGAAGEPANLTRDVASPRVRGFGTSVFTEMSQLANEHGAVNLGQGFPDFPGPSFLKEAAKAALDADLNQYAVSHGAPRLRAAIART